MLIMERTFKNLLTHSYDSNIHINVYELKQLVYSQVSEYNSVVEHLLCGYSVLGSASGKEKEKYWFARNFVVAALYNPGTIRYLDTFHKWLFDWKSHIFQKRLHAQNVSLNWYLQAHMQNENVYLNLQVFSI